MDVEACSKSNKEQAFRSLLDDMIAGRHRELFSALNELFYCTPWSLLHVRLLVTNSSKTNSSL